MRLLISFATLCIVAACAAPQGFGNFNAGRPINQGGPGFNSGPQYGGQNFGHAGQRPHNQGGPGSSPGFNSGPQNGGSSFGGGPGTLPGLGTGPYNKPGFQPGHLPFGAPINGFATANV